MRRRIAGLTVAGAIVLVALPAAPAGAHAVVLGTSPPAGAVVPDAPGEVTLVFNQDVTADPDAVRVTDPDGEPAGTGAATIKDSAVRLALRPDLPDGVYTVRYEVSARDGHPIEGRYQFGVGKADPLAAGTDTDRTPGLGLAVVLRWVVFAGLALALGGLAGDRLARRYPEAGAPPAPWVWPGALAGLVGTAGLAAQAVGGGSVLDGLGELGDLARSSAGRALLVELAGFAAVLACCAVPRRVRPAARLAQLAALVVVAGADAVRGHPEENLAGWGTVLGVAHLGAAAVWVGALAHVIRAGWAWRGARPGRGAGWLLTYDYSRLAVALFAAVALTGTLAAVVVLPDLGALTGTGYGRALLVKIVLVLAGATLALSARRLLARISARDRPVPPGYPARAEAGVLVAVLAVTALAVSLSPGVTQGAPLALAPAPVGPVVPVGTRVGQVSVGVAASSGQVIIRLHAPDPGGGEVPHYTVSVRLREPGGTAGRLAVRGCGTGCFTAPVQWRVGTSDLTVDVSAPPWKAGTARLAVPWPPDVADRRLLDAVVARLRATPQVVVHERITSDTTEPITGDAVPITGPQFLSAEPYGAGTLPPAVVLGRTGELTDLALGYLTEGIYITLRVAPDGRIVREWITGPNHLTDRTLDYAPAG